VSGASEARDAVHAALRGAYGPCFRAGTAYAAAVKAALAETDLVAAMGAALDVIRCAEHLHDVAELAAKDARNELAKQMSETGCHQVATATLTGYLQKKPAYVMIDGESAIPQEFMATPAPKPDKHALKSALDGGREIPGASLIRPNEAALAIRTRTST
jgi:hypothetical protein